MQGAGLWSPPTASSAIFIRDGVLTGDVVVNGSAQTSPASLSKVCERRLRENRNRQDGQKGLPVRPQQAKQAEVEVKVEPRSDPCNLSLGLNLHLSESWRPLSPSCLGLFDLDDRLALIRSAIQTGVMRQLDLVALRTDGHARWCDAQFLCASLVASFP